MFHGSRDGSGKALGNVAQGSVTGVNARLDDVQGTAAIRPRALPSRGAASVAPFRPHCEHRAERRSTSLDASSPQRMTSGASAIGAECRQAAFWQCTHGPAGLLAELSERRPRPLILAHAPKHRMPRALSEAARDCWLSAAWLYILGHGDVSQRRLQQVRPAQPDQLHRRARGSLSHRGARPVAAYLPRLASMPRRRRPASATASLIWTA